jgi:hypothetical protein
MPRNYQGHIHGNPTECICPRCQRTHHLVMIWIGHGIPRKFCEGCKKVIEYLGELPEPTVKNKYVYPDLTHYDPFYLNP